MFDIGLNEKLDDSTLVLDDTVNLTCTTFHFVEDITSHGIFIDGGDGYWYGFSNEENETGNATMLWIKIKQSDYSYTEGSWTLSNAQLVAVGEYKEDSSYPTSERAAVIRNGYLYVPAYNKTGIYKINLSNSTDVTLLSLGFESELSSIGDSGTPNVLLSMIGDMIVGYDFEIDVNDNVIATYGEVRCGSVATPFFQYKEYVFAWGGSYGDQYRYTWILTPYLATICNLSEAVVKNANKTMKITYTLTETYV